MRILGQGPPDGHIPTIYPYSKGDFCGVQVSTCPSRTECPSWLASKARQFKQGSKQRTIIQETLRTPWTTTDNTAEVQQISTPEGVKRSHRSLTQETLKTPKISMYALSREDSMHVCLIEGTETWMTPYRHYLADGILPLEHTEARVVKKNSCKYTMVDGDLFRHEYSHPTLICISGEQCTRIMAELHKGICGSHINGRALSSKAIRTRYYWPTMREDCTRYAQRWKKCQQHADWHKAPQEELRSIHSPWSFHT